MCSALRGMLRHCMQVNECLQSCQQPHFLREFVVPTAKKRKKKKKRVNLCSGRNKQNRIINKVMADTTAML